MTKKSVVVRFFEFLSKLYKIKQVTSFIDLYKIY